ncbi:MAG: 30S ribosomal protein S3 [Patescibacteria group bacterium]
MGHKVHPKAYRIGTTTTWPSRWFARKELYRNQIQMDYKIRDFFKKQLKEAGLSAVLIERSRGTLTINLKTAKPGVVIGHSGSGIEDLKKKFLNAFYRGKKVQLQINVQEVPKAGLEAAVVCQQVIVDLERRMPFRRVLKQTIERVKKAGALGVKISVSGRLNGAEIARREWLYWGKIPLSNLRADIDYHQDFARTMMGAIGVKIWIYRGDVFAKDRYLQYQPSTPRNQGTRDKRERRQTARS